MDIYLERKDVEPLANKTFPDYKGKHFRVETATSYRPHAYWEGGSCEYFKALQLLPDGTITFPSVQGITNNPFEGPCDQSIEIPVDGMIVVHVYFCGKDMGLRFIVHPQSILLPKLIPAPADLTPEEKTVLVATKSTKSSYAGDSNIRFHEAQRWTGITQAQWDAAKASCTGKGYLDKRGAITIKGRNALGEFIQLHQLPKLNQTDCQTSS